MPNTARETAEIERARAQRRRSTLDAAQEAGFLSGERGRIGARVPVSLLRQAKEATGIRSDTELLEYALSEVALRDDFAAKLVARSGTIPPDLDLDF